MNANTRRLRAEIRRMTREIRAQRRAARRVATGLPQTAKTHLVAAGLPVETADRFAGAFSRSVIPTAKTTTRIKPVKRSRKTLEVAVKLYDLPTFHARLAVYRPAKDVAAANLFAHAASAA